jgi:hypothetical protein
MVAYSHTTARGAMPPSRLSAPSRSIRSPGYGRSLPRQERETSRTDGRNTGDDHEHHRQAGDRDQ